MLTALRTIHRRRNCWMPVIAWACWLWTRRMMSSSPEGLSQLERLIRRDRNHPSVIIWSLGNEEREQGTERGARIVTTMKRLTKSLDPTRPVTVAMNGGWGRGVTNVVDVMGFNYAGGG